MLIDAHAHLQNLSETELEDVINFARKTNIKKIVVNATSEADWDKTLELASSYKEIVAQLGLHPWYVDSASDSWQTKLTNLLKQNQDIGVGEIGLDHSPKHQANFAKQLEVFEAQLELAASLNRPVSIHCIKAWGDLIPALKSYKLKILFHGFYASPEITKELLNFDANFSFSEKVLTCHPKDKIKALLDLIPNDRLLVESDGAPFKLPQTAQLLWTS